MCDPSRRSSRSCEQVVEDTLRWLEEQGAGAWLDQGTEHPHRLALSVRLDRLHDAHNRLAHGFSDRGIQASDELLHPETPASLPGTSRRPRWCWTCDPPSLAHVVFLHVPL